MGFFFQKHLCFAVSEVHLLVHKMLDFRSKSKLYINAIRQAFDELQQLKSATA
jgi:hypothetical protein